MTELAVAINGYGTIGKRVADAVRAQPDMAVAGVAKTSPNHEAYRAVERGYPLYTAVSERESQFEEADIPTAGPVEALVECADVVVDATPSGIGAENAALYDRHDTPAVFQGGEDAAVAQTSFTARANYETAIGADSVRVVSCNTTGLCRLLAPLEEAYGIEKVRTTLVRRGGDPSQTGRGPINDILPDPVEIPSHHGPDVQTVMPSVDIDTLGLKVPATLMHLHSVNVTLASPPTSADDVQERLAGEDRLLLVPPSWDANGTGPLKEYALDRGRPRGDIWENAIWTESLTLEGPDLYLFQAIHQESDVVPENIDAIRAVTETASAAESVARTNDALDL
ncbi:MAG: type II glyceraldehyde-3-phosphate dehydrogenase [Halobacteriaceae archaeon]